MSSNICSSKHFNSIEQSLVDIYVNRLGKPTSFPYVLRKSFPFCYDGSDAVRARKEIYDTMDELRRMNVLAYTLQYKSHYVGKLDSAISEQTEIVFSNKTSKKELSRPGLFKALVCLRYQIEEDQIVELRSLSVAEEKAMDFLKEITDAIAHNICMDIEDKTNSWSIE